ncbi:glycoside hydrolase family 48 protein [Pseudobacteroides cellulosolvens]|uniref:Cellulose 1,4-beta-cellobiosidase n=1 Tax=Pseudobacteroides cellulosolvens ATCC 35603 = DSM 2933 TaxID=398512 RepID=A0A0L6JL07_9FIRM|nr:glycoside hydrolase family 48 protein [Pseudobacteroides cellulosolvens]KNY26506.1 Cellulose 1,4-beta-cellobiosidase [Pseudobacteroides cellulosolvens ATCC 35603 = DSM 2933]
MFHYLQLEAAQGYFTGDWSGYNKAWDTISKYAIPSNVEQPGFESGYNFNDCSFYYPEGSLLDYPQKVNRLVKGSKDPLYWSLSSFYNKKTILGIHNLLDVDNWHKYGNMGTVNSRVSKINITGRGPGETIWQRLMIPAWDAFTGKPAFSSLVYKSDMLPKPWTYITSSTGDTNIIKSAYYANKWASEQNMGSEVKSSTSSAGKLGNYLRYSMLDKYMKPIGCNSVDTVSDGASAFHYLISSGYSWGSNVEPNDFAWIKGSDILHQKNQNPLAAYALSSTSNLVTGLSGASLDWNKSIDMQLEFLQWLQSAEGAIAGGCTNSWGYNYKTPPKELSHFYKMTYDVSPGTFDQLSNGSFLSQCRSIVNLAEYYYQTGDERAYSILRKWVDWVKPYVKVDNFESFEIPSQIEWEGMPDTWTGTYTGNSYLHATITSMSSDLEAAAILSRILLTYSYATKKYSYFDADAQDIGEKLLNTLVLSNKDDSGFTNEEQRGDYSRVFDNEIYIPEGWESNNGQGAKLKNGCKYIDTRPALRQDPSWNNLYQAYEAGVSPMFKYHRFSTQCEIALALFAAYIQDSDIPTSTPAYTPTPTLPTQSILPDGDINGDRIVNMADVIILAGCFGLTSGETGFLIECDINRDGAINMKDVIIIANNFGKTNR